VPVKFEYIRSSSFAWTTSKLKISLPIYSRNRADLFAQTNIRASWPSANKANINWSRIFVGLQYSNFRKDKIIENVTRCFCLTRSPLHINKIILYNTLSLQKKQHLLSLIELTLNNIKIILTFWPYYSLYEKNEKHA
jgi:hypothetical protein